MPGATVAEQRHDILELISLFLDMAERKTFAPVMWLYAEVYGKQDQEGMPDPKRRPSFCVKCPTTRRKVLDVITFLFLWSLYATAARAEEGGKHLTLHLRYGRRRPDERVVANVIRLLRDSGLQAVLKKRLPDSVSVFISFRKAFEAAQPKTRS